MSEKRIPRVLSSGGVFLQNQRLVNEDYGGVTMGKIKTHNDFLHEVFLKYGDEYEVIGQYINAKSKLTFRHICGNTFERTPDSYSRAGLICRKCYKTKWTADPRRAKSRVENRAKEFYKLFDKLSEGKYQLLSEYTGADKHISIKCLTCGNINNQRPSDFMSGKRCKSCGIKRRANYRLETARTQFKSKLFLKYGHKIELIGEYLGAKEFTDFKCNTCENLFNTTPVSVTNKNVKFGCPLCGHSSSGETRIKEYFDLNKIVYETEFSFSDLVYKYKLKFDFAVFPNLNKDSPLLLIEFDGQQHFKPISHFGGEEALQSTRIRDELKNKYCDENGLKLLRIPYWDYERIEEILEKEVSGF
jgi:Zn finger protein HypA/HybF involved in hydrogenase expression